MGLILQCYIIVAGGEGNYVWTMGRGFLDADMPSNTESKGLANGVGINCSND